MCLRTVFVIDYPKTMRSIYFMRITFVQSVREYIVQNNLGEECSKNILPLTLNNVKLKIGVTEYSSSRGTLCT